MHTLIAAALADAAPLVASRGWALPSAATLAEGERLLALVARDRAPTVQVTPDGALRLEWEAADQGWLRLVVDGHGQLAHSAVIAGDEFELREDFGEALPDWAAQLLARLLRVGH